MLNDNTPDGAGSLTGNGPTGFPAIQNAGAGSRSVSTTASIPRPPAKRLSIPVFLAELRILGIPGNQTTGQQRVPVIITSLRDDTVGTTVRGVAMFNILENDPIYTQVINPGAR